MCSFALTELLTHTSDKTKLTFFSQSKNVTFYVFFSCCAHFPNTGISALSDVCIGAVLLSCPVDIHCSGAAVRHDVAKPQSECSCAGWRRVTTNLAATRSLADPQQGWVGVSPPLVCELPKKSKGVNAVLPEHWVLGEGQAASPLSVSMGVLRSDVRFSSGVRGGVPAA